MVVAVVFAAVPLRRRGAGLPDYRGHEQCTGTLEIPIRWAFVPALVPLALRNQKPVGESFSVTLLEISQVRDG